MNEDKSIYRPLLTKSDAREYGDDAQYTQILCPVCRFNYNHTHGVREIPGNDGYEAGWWGRGDLIVIDMTCENGDKWELCIGFHKGNQFIFARIPAEAKTD